MDAHGKFVVLGLLAGMAAVQGLGQTTAATPTPAAETPSQTFTVPAGTKVLLSLKSGINTKTAQQGDGVYLVSSFPRFL
jgi:type IV secretion system protein VirB10